MPSSIQEDAVFRGWQKTGWGDTVPLYKILKEGHPSCRSTVTGKALLALDLRIPWTPTPYLGVGSSPRYKLGAKLVAPATATEVLEATGLNYTVVRLPWEEVENPNHPDVPSPRWANVRTDTGDILGLVGDTDEPIQNRDAFTFFDNLVRTHEAIYETAGTFERVNVCGSWRNFPGSLRFSGKTL